MVNQVAARRYTLDEVDALRAAVNHKLAHRKVFRAQVAGPPPKDLEPDLDGLYALVDLEPADPAIVEDQLRTAMMAGLTAEDFCEPEG